jgi:hypothetical protein
MQNPYLPQQAQSITNQVNQNLQQQQLPGINSGAIAAGGFGGSRQGIAQGLAIGQTNQALGNSLANLNFNAWNQGEQNRMQQQGLDNSFTLGMGNLGLGQFNAQTQRDLGFGNLALGNKQADNSFNLGQQAQNTNQFGAQTQRDLGMGNLALGYTQANQNFALGQGNLANQQQQTANNFTLGQGNLALGNKQADNSYNLGLGNLGLGQMQANQNFYTQQRGQDMQQAGLGANLIQGGNSGLQQGGQGLYNLGLTQQQAPLNALQAYAQMLSPFTGLNNSNTQTQPGASTLGSALGGALTAAQIWQLLSGGK